MSNNLTLTNAAFTTTGGKQYLSAGYGLTSGNILPKNNGALQFPFGFGHLFYIAAPPSGVGVMDGSTNIGWMGYNQGQLIANLTVGNGNNGGQGLTLSASGAFADGAVHHVFLWCEANGTSFYVDGVLQGAKSSSVVSPTDLTTAFGVRDFGGYSGQGFTFTGFMRNVEFWTAAPTYFNAAGFTPPKTQELTGTESGLQNYWKLAGDGTDSTATNSPAPTAQVPANNANINYSPWNWLVNTAAAKSLNPGAYLEAVFSVNSGGTPQLQFDVRNTAAEPTEITVEVDGLTKERFQLTTASSGLISFTMPSQTTGWPHHSIRVIQAANSGDEVRWTAPQKPAAVFIGFNGITLLTPMQKKVRKIVCFGDSITEGLRAISTTAVSGNDSQLGWAFRLGENLGADVGVIGFGGQGLGYPEPTTLVPAFNLSYNMLWDQQARDFSTPVDAIVLNFGTNVQNSDEGQFATAYAAAINGLLGVSSAPICVMRTFSGLHDTGVRNAIAAVNSPRVTYIDTTGWLDTSETPEGYHPYGVASVKLSRLLAAALAPILAGASGGAGGIGSLLGIGSVFDPPPFI